MFFYLQHLEVYCSFISFTLLVWCYFKWNVIYGCYFKCKTHNEALLFYFLIKTDSVRTERLADKPGWLWRWRLLQQRAAPPPSCGPDFPRSRGQPAWWACNLLRSADSRYTLLRDWKSTCDKQEKWPPNINRWFWILFWRSSGNHSLEIAQLTLKHQTALRQRLCFYFHYSQIS